MARDSAVPSAGDGAGVEPIHLHHDGLSRPLENPTIRVLSLGAGVQSTTLALMAARGDLGPKPDCAIFSDTGAEPAGVYRHLGWLESILPFPVHRVSSGNLRDEIYAAARDEDGMFFRIPAFVTGEDGKPAPMPRSCTRDYKIDPITQKVRGLIGLKPRQSIRAMLMLKRKDKLPVLVEQWIGISTDEIERLKRAREPWIHQRHPLIEARMSRRDCLKWMAERQYLEPPKSACTFCPWHDNAMWRGLRDNDPESWADAVAVDRAMRVTGPHRGMRSHAFLHRKLVPLDEVDLSAPDEPGLGFINECEGMCGV